MKNKNKITVDNCVEKMHAIELSENAQSQAAAWKIVHDFCVQIGMKYPSKLTGLETVINFIQKLHDK